MPRRFVLASLLVLSAFVDAAQARRPDGGARVETGAADTMSPEMDRHIVAEVERSLAKLQAEGRPPAPVPLVSGLAWPLGTSPGGSREWYGVSGFVDLDPRSPGYVRDYTCGTRTYDTAAGYNHGGADYIPWPFPWHMMDTAPVDIHAAAPGTLVLRVDGVADRACDWNGPDAMNHVVVRHDDGTIARYLHMKRGTVTTRPVGSAIAAGEVLGKVGSSGISKVPHLHFELRTSNSAGATVIEPHAGACRAGASAWADQAPYRQPLLTRLSTHSRMPHYPTCPDTFEEPYLSDQFAPGATVTVVAAYRDVRVGQVTTFRVVDARGAVASGWTFDPDEDPDVTEEYVDGAWWNWNVPLPADAPPGLWFVEAEFDGRTERHAFRVGTTTQPIADLRGLIGAWYEPATAGQGFEFHWIGDGTALVFFYGHRDGGANFFLLGQRDLPFDFGQEIELPMYRTTGGRWTGFDPAVIQRPSWGTARITFVDCEHAVAELDGLDGSQLLELQRLGRTDGLECQ